MAEMRWTSSSGRQTRPICSKHFGSWILNFDNETITQVLSYGGELSFTIDNQGGSTLLPANILATYPLVQLQGNGQS